MVAANLRAMEINSENRKTGKQKKLLRPYKCKICGNIHLTSMNKMKYKWRNDVNFRNKIHEQKFIKEESKKWEQENDC
ncbi:hypothetical protein LCGC14_1008940 [marine sediment metagenome]|uniref:Uncharacterized protein n=1 Tax=marine sediment metagenome TaxID=412755 RepID=A0A0F9QJ58_9ZZZZ